MNNGVGRSAKCTSKLPLGAWVCAAVALLMTCTDQAEADEVAASLLVRTDSDHTTVFAPRVRARGSLMGDTTHFDVAYSADIWTSASIDVRTAATVAVSEQRDEIELGIDHELTDLTLSASYRFSNEQDYISHGVSMGADLDVANGDATLGVRGTFTYDLVGRSGDASLPYRLATLDARFVYTQVLDAETILQGVYEVSRAKGFQSNVYRFVGIGGDGICRQGAILCIPEVHPRERVRHALVVRVRHALGDSFSIGAGYRLYTDSWKMWGHTARVGLAWLPDDASVVRLQYRGHLQTKAGFYWGTYRLTDLDTQSYFTRDRDLGGLASHRLALSYERDVELVSASPPLHLTLALGGTRIGYDDFVGLTEVWALDLTLGALWEL